MRRGRGCFIFRFWADSGESDGTPRRALNSCPARLASAMPSFARLASSQPVNSPSLLCSVRPWRRITIASAAAKALGWQFDARGMVRTTFSAGRPMYKASTAGAGFVLERSTARSKREGSAARSINFRSSSSLANALTAGWSVCLKWPGTRLTSSASASRAARNSPLSSKKAPDTWALTLCSVRCGIKSPDGNRSNE